MKKVYALLLTIVYLAFSAGSLRAEFTLQEKDFQESIVSLKGEESAVHHFIRAPKVSSSPIVIGAPPVTARVVTPANVIKVTASPPIYLINCNFRR